MLIAAVAAAALALAETSDAGGKAGDCGISLVCYMGMFEQKLPENRACGDYHLLTAFSKLLNVAANRAQYHHIETGISLGGRREY